MKKLLLLLLLIQTSFFAQDITKDLEKKLLKANELLDKGKYQQAAETYKESVKELEKQVGENDTTILTIYNLLSGMAHDSIADYQSAYSYYAKSYNGYVNANASDNYYAIQALNGMLFDADMVGDVDNGLKFRELILDYKIATYGENSSECALYLNDIAIFLYEHQNKKAIEYYQRAIKVFEAVEGKKSLNAALVKNNVALMYYYQGQWDEVEGLYREVMRTYSNDLSENMAEYFQALTNDAGYYYNLGQFDTAQQLLETDLPILNEILGVNEYSYNANVYLSDIYTTKGEKQKALISLKNVYNLSKELYGEVSFYTCKNLGNAYYSLSKFDSAIIYYDEAIKLYEAMPIHDNEDLEIYLITLQEKSISHKEQKEFDVAFELSEKILKNAKYGSFAYILGMGVKGDVYFSLGNFIEASKIYDERLKLYKQNFSKNDLTVAIMTGMLAHTKAALGQFQDAELLFKESLELYNQLGNNLEKNTALNNYALMFKDLGNFKKAIPIFKDLLNNPRLESTDPLLAYTATMNLAVCYIQSNEMDLGYEQLLASEKIAEKYNLKNTPNYAMSYPNFSWYYQSTGQQEKANEYLQKGLEVQKGIFGSESQQYYMMLLTVAANEMKNDRINDAIKSLLLNVELQTKSFGKVIYEIGDLYTTLAACYLINDDFVSAKKYFDVAREDIFNDIYRNFSFLSENEKELYFLKKKQMLDMYNSYCVYSSNINPENVNELYDVALRSKGILLNSGIQMRKEVLMSNDKSLKEKYQKWIDLNKQINQMSSDPSAQDQANSLTQKANTIEKELVQATNQIDVKNIKWESIQKKLKSGEVAIEFLHFAPFGIDDNDKKYIALILTPDTPPHLVELFRENQLAELIGKSSSNSVHYVNTIYGTKEQPLDQLYQLIWKPLDEYFTSIHYKPSRAYISKDGLLHKVAFDAIFNSGGEYVSETLVFEDVLSTQQVLQKEKIHIQNALVVGGVDYGKGDVWSYLEGTKNEADKISSVLSQREINVNELTGAQASEIAVRKQTIENDVIHIATHGFFFDEYEEQQAEVIEEVNFRSGNISTAMLMLKSEDALKRSGIALSNANTNWNSNVNSENDGILTAAEVKELNLERAKLVVLSACETGLGDIKGSEGVYGLQRAFKMAGVDKLIMSLWQVPDKETVEFMSLFYTNLNEFSIQEAFRKTQEAMKEKYAPYFWAAFVLVE